MRKMAFAAKPVGFSKDSDRHRRMIDAALDLLEFTLKPQTTLVAIAEKSDAVSERLWEIALERRPPLDRLR